MGEGRWRCGWATLDEEGEGVHKGHHIPAGMVVRGARR